MKVMSKLRVGLALALVPVLVITTTQSRRRTRDHEFNLGESKSPTLLAIGPRHSENHP